MLVIQHNYGWGYKNTIASLEAALSIGAEIICLQQLFIENKSITHSVFNFYWLRRLKTEARVLTAVKKELVDKIIVENMTDLIDHRDFLALNI